MNYSIPDGSEFRPLKPGTFEDDFKSMNRGSVHVALGRIALFAELKEILEQRGITVDLSRARIVKFTS